MARRVKVAVAGVVAGAMLVGAGVYATVRVVAAAADRAIPQADLFGVAAPSPTATARPRPSPTPPPGSDIKGPLNILIIGEDTRVSSGTAPHNDANMILHVSKDLRSAYLTSLPRDLLVDVPAFAPSGSRASRTRLTHAITFGSRIKGRTGYDTEQGFPLVFQTISAYTGIDHFDAGVLFSFRGMERFVDAIGGIDIYVDHRTTSIHRQPSGEHRPSCGSCPHGYGGPQQVYEVGMQHMVGWQALDYARQRYGLPGGAYGRELHQRQIVHAVMDRLIRAGLVLNPAAIAEVLDAVGETVIFDGRGRTPSEFGWALRRLRPSTVTLVGLPGGGVFSSGGDYLGESLNSSVKNSYFDALRRDRLDEWVKNHRRYVNSANP